MTPELPRRPLTEDEIAAFRRDGVVCIRQLYSPKWVERLVGLLDRVYDTPSPFGPPPVPGVPPSKFRSDVFLWHLDDAVRDFVLQAPTAHVVQQAFDSRKINFFYDQIFIKKQLTPDPTPWHHDYSFWPMVGNQIASIWTSVDAVDTESSALEFVAGSHLWDKEWKAVGADGIVFSSSQLEQLPDIDADRGRFDIVSWALDPGDALLFHARTVHGSRGNRSPHRQRRAITTRWCGDDVIYRQRERGMPIPWAHGLQDGDALSGPIFPQVLPEIDLAALARRLAGPVPPDPLKVAETMRRVATAERVPVRMETF